MVKMDLIHHGSGASPVLVQWQRPELLLKHNIYMGQVMDVTEP